MSKPVSDPVKLAELQKYWEEGRFKELQEAAEDYTLEYRKDLQGFLYGGKASLALKDFDEANYYFRLASGIDESNEEILLALAKIGLERKSMSVARANFRKLLEINPSNSAALVGLGDAAYFDNNQSLAIESYNKALETGVLSSLEDSEKNTLLFKTADAYKKVGLIEEGLEFIKKYKGDTFNEALALVERDFYRKIGKESEVLSCTELLHKNVPTNAKYILELAELLKAKGEDNQVAELYTTLLNLGNLEDRTRAEALYARANMFVSSEKYAEALQDFNQLIDIDSKWYYYQERAEVWIKHKKGKEALADYNKAIELQDSPLYGTIKSRGDLYFKAKAYDKAIADYTRLVELDASNPDGYLALAAGFRAKKDIKKAFKMYLEAELHGSLEASALLKKHFAKQVAQMREKSVAGLLPKYEKHFASNATSPILQQVFGKLWIPDMNKLILAMENELVRFSESLVKKLLDKMAQDMFLMTKEGFLFFEGTDAPLEALYKVDVESQHAVLIEAQPTKGGELSSMRLGFHDGSLMITYPVQDIEVTAKYFKAVTNPTEDRKKRLTAKQYSNTYLQSIEELISTLFG